MLKSVKYDLHCTLPFVALGITLAPPALPMSTLHPRAKVLLPAKQSSESDISQ